MLNVPPPLSTGNISSFYVLPTPTQNPKVGILPPDATVTPLTKQD